MFYTHWSDALFVRLSPNYSTKLKVLTPTSNILSLSTDCLLRDTFEPALAKTALVTVTHHTFFVHFRCFVDASVPMFPEVWHRDLAHIQLPVSDAHETQSILCHETRSLWKAALEWLSGHTDRCMHVHMNEKVKHIVLPWPTRWATDAQKCDESHFIYWQTACKFAVALPLCHFCTQHATD